MNAVIITGIIGLLTTIIGSTVSFIFTRKKYYTEVDSKELNNIKESITIYKAIVSDYIERLQFYVTMSSENRAEVLRLKEIVYKLIDNVCLDKTCRKRDFLTEADIKNILEDTNKNTDKPTKKHRTTKTVKKDEPKVS